jgi:hypothetical protein
MDWSRCVATVALELSSDRRRPSPGLRPPSPATPASIRTILLRRNGVPALPGRLWVRDVKRNHGHRLGSLDG